MGCALTEEGLRKTSALQDGIEEKVTFPRGWGWRWGVLSRRRVYEKRQFHRTALRKVTFPTECALTEVGLVGTRRER